MALNDPVSGLEGKAHYGATPTEIDITKWDFERSTGTIDTTRSSNASAGYRSKIPNGFIEGSGNIEGLVLQGVDLPAMGTVLTIKLSSTPTRFWSGPAIITRVGESLDVPGENAQVITFDFVTTGLWELTDTTT